jgi:hypothetical protein
VPKALSEALGTFEYYHFFAFFTGGSSTMRSEFINLTFPTGTVEHVLGTVVRQGIVVADFYAIIQDIVGYQLCPQP